MPVVYSSSAVLTEARRLIGTSYSEMDCSHFVHRAYASAGLRYQYADSASFHLRASGVDRVFIELSPNEPKQAGDVIVMKGHMGIWDPEGCMAISNKESAYCGKFSGNAPFLSAMSGGTDYGKVEWWKSAKKVYRWIGPQMP